MIIIRWSDALTLIKKVPPEDGDMTNEEGYPLKLSEVGRFVFGNKLPVWQSEYFKAKQSGVKIEFKFEIYAHEYEGERIAEYNGRRYKVLHGEESKNGEFIRLMLSDLSERG